MAVKKILIVDDSATDRFYLTDLLEGAGYEVVALESGEACVEKAAEINPDLIVMDIIMTGLSGFQATRSIVKDPNTSKIPVVLCSGKLQVTDHTWAAKMGAVDCIQKPIGLEELEAIVAKLEA